MINNLQNELLKRNNRCVELEEEVWIWIYLSNVQKTHFFPKSGFRGLTMVDYKLGHKLQTL